MGYTTITAVWSGAIGLPGYTRFRFGGQLDILSATAAAVRVADFFQGIKPYIPMAITITLDGQAQLHDDQGVLTGELAYPPPLPFYGTGVGNYAGGSGAVVNWRTGMIVAGRRITGRTFLVPLVAAFANDGTLDANALNTLRTKAVALLAGDPVLVIASHTGGSAGTIASVVGASVPDRAAQLRSRRQ